MEILDAETLLARLERIYRRLGHDEFKKLKVVLSDDDAMNGVHYGIWVDLAKKDDVDLQDLYLDDIQEDMFILIG